MLQTNLIFVIRKVIKYLYIHIIEIFLQIYIFIDLQKLMKTTYIIFNYIYKMIND